MIVSGRQRGFTLLEMMLVLLLLGLGASMVVSQMPNATYRAAQESQRLAERLQRLTYQAALEGRAYGLVVQRDRWQLRRWQAQGWQNLSLPHGAGAQTLPAGWHLQLIQPGPEAEDGVPQVLLLPGGEIMPFRLRYFSAGQLMAEIVMDDEGGIHTDNKIDEKL
ncbi:type II secretion system minor pseudopilin GspH [Cedecea colo]|uniref:Type II secretion system protein H n=1 Tax=Cedecea colo TaxID=2552946 RepID=A0ABX0VGP1_9ENTR|nr:type II secretion system minor pseudopilin GspH [Cedecea colo]NIY46293.1 type II secretion system protein GspH [Cedecea colo]